MKRRNLMIPRPQHAFGIFNRTRRDWSAEKPTRPVSTLQNSSANCSFCRSNSTESPDFPRHKPSCSTTPEGSRTHSPLQPPKKQALRESEKFSRSAKARPNVVFSVRISSKRFVEHSVRPQMQPRPQHLRRNPKNLQTNCTPSRYLAMHGNQRTLSP